MFLLKVLVFAAAATAGYLTVAMVFKASSERMENRELGRRFKEIRRFISALDLMRLRLTCGLLTGAAVMTLLIFGGVLQPLVYIPVAVGMAVLAFFAPLWYFTWKAHRRHELFENKLLDLAVSLANGMKSGLALPQALEAVARRVGEPMAEELGVVLREYRLGLELSEALERLNERMPCEDLHLLVTTIRLTTKSGGSLVEVLEKTVVMIRGRREFQERLKNMTAQGRFEALAMSLAPLAAFILLYIIDPGLMRPVLFTGIGWCGIAIVVVLVSIGYWFINKIVTIEV